MTTVSSASTRLCPPGTHDPTKAAPRIRPLRPGWTALRLTLAAVEVVLITVAALVATTFLSNGRPGGELAAVAAIMASPLIVFPLWVSGRYRLEQLSSVRSACTTGVWTALLGGGLSVLAIQVGAQAGSEPVAWAAATWASVGSVVLLHRILVTLWLRRQLARGRLAHRVAVIAPHEPADHAALNRDLAAAREQPCQLNFVRAPRPRSADLRGLDDILARVRELAPDEILILSDPWSTRRAWSSLPQMLGDGVLRKLQRLSYPVTVAWSHGHSEPTFFFTTLVAPPLSETDRLIKRACDLIGASALLLLFVPVFALLALMIKLESPGPVFFVQQRRGLDNVVFDVLKFRSMHVAMCDPSALHLTTRNDPRVTRVGAFIRRWSLDELPQLLNVIEGTMSLVGPRPHPLQAKAGARLYEEVVSDFALRYRVKPGITGWAQVNGLRGSTDTEEKLICRFAYDMEYIQRWSIWLDLKILVRTPLVSMQGENAY